MESCRSDEVSDARKPRGADRPLAADGRRTTADGGLTAAEGGLTTAEGGSTAVEGRLTVGELARTVGMAPRTIRAHQARNLLTPPVRQGRFGYYHSGHVRRLETIKSLQRRGFNLVAIQAMLGAREPQPDGDPLTSAVRRLAELDPHLVPALTRHGVVVRGADHSVHLLRPMLLRCVLDLHRAGVQPSHTLRVLIDALDRSQRFADDLVLLTCARILSLAPHPANGPESPSAAHPDRSAARDGGPDRVGMLAQGIAALLTEAFRVEVERSGRALLPDLLADRDPRPRNGRKVYAS